MIADLVDGTRKTYHGTAEGIRNHVFGSNGVLETTCGGQVLIRGEYCYRRGDADGVEAVVAALKRLAPKAEKADGLFHRQEVDQ
jgi:hypothetical protein